MAACGITAAGRGSAIVETKKLEQEVAGLSAEERALIQILRIMSNVASADRKRILASALLFFGYRMEE
jgi:hypothetical protein